MSYAKFVYAGDALAQAGLTRNGSLATRKDARRAGSAHRREQRAVDAVHRASAAEDVRRERARDDGLSRLDADDYLLFRVVDQLNYFPRGRPALPPASRCSFQLSRAFGRCRRTLLAAAGLETWIRAHHGHRGSGRRAISHPSRWSRRSLRTTRPRGDSRSLQRLWGAQPAESRDFDWLVSEAEGVLATELSGWVQQMNQAVEEASEEARRRQKEQAGRDGGIVASKKRLAGLRRPRVPPWNRPDVFISYAREGLRSSSSST